MVSEKLRRKSIKLADPKRIQFFWEKKLYAAHKDLLGHTISAVIDGTKYRNTYLENNLLNKNQYCLVINRLLDEENYDSKGNFNFSVLNKKHEKLLKEALIKYSKVEQYYMTQVPKCNCKYFDYKSIIDDLENIKTQINDEGIYMYHNKPVQLKEIKNLDTKNLKKIIYNRCKKKKHTLSKK